MQALTKLIALAIAITGAGLSAAFADDAGQPTIEVGQPARIEVFPAAVKLAGPRSHAQLVVTGHFADGSVQDLTSACQFASTNSEIATVASAVVRPHADGKAQIAVVVAGRAAIVPVEVSGMTQPQPVSFEFEALAAISKQC